MKKMIILSLVLIGLNAYAGGNGIGGGGGGGQEGNEHPCIKVEKGHGGNGYADGGSTGGVDRRNGGNDPEASSGHGGAEGN